MPKHVFENSCPFSSIFIYIASITTLWKPWNELRPHLLCKHCKLQLHHFWAYMHDGHDHWKRNEVTLKEVKSVTVGTPNTEECKEWYHDRKTCCSLNFAVSAYKQDSSLTERSLEKGKHNICVVYGPMFPVFLFSVLWCQARLFDKNCLQA